MYVYSTSITVSTRTSTVTVVQYVPTKVRRSVSGTCILLISDSVQSYKLYVHVRTYNVTYYESTFEGTFEGILLCVHVLSKIDTYCTSKYFVRKYLSRYSYLASYLRRY